MAGARQASRSGLDARNAAEMRRQPHASGAVAAEAEGRSARRDQRGLASARPTGGAREIVGIVGAAADQVIAFEGEQKIGQVGSGDRNGSSGAQARHYRRIADRRRGRFPAERAGRAHSTFHLDRIFDGKRNAGESRKRIALGPLAIHTRGRLPRRFLQHLGDGVQARIHLFNTPKMRFH